MVRTSDVIFPVMGLRRAAIYLISMASMICWMKVCSSSRVSRYSFFLNNVCLLRLQFGRLCRPDLG